MRLLRRGPVLTRLNIRAPAPAPDRAGVLIAAILRNEARHVGEWAAFHRAAGAAGLVVYDDGSDDGTGEIARRAFPGAIVLPWAQRFESPPRRWGRALRLHNQVAANAHATMNFGGRYRWMICLDGDEFLMPTGGATLDEALTGFEGSNLSLPWHMFGRAGLEEPGPDGVVASFVRRARDPMDASRGASGFKTLFDPCAATVMGVHAVQTEGGRTWNDAGREATFATRSAPGFLSDERLRLNHYYARGDAELRAKVARGSNLGDPEYGRRVRRTVEAIERDTVEDRRAADWIARRREDGPAN
ncbi:MAG: glycosyltransferase family 2 protein [Hasllibacter sp.]